MKPLASLAVLCCIAALAADGVVGQITITAKTRSEVRVVASSDGGRVVRSIPANTDVSKGFQLSASSSGFCRGSASATLTVGAGGVSLGFLAKGVTTGCIGSGSAGSNGILFTYSASTPTAGQLLLSASAGSPNSSSANLWVDVGDDGQRELNTRTGALVLIDVVLTPRGVPALVGGGASASQGTAGAGLTSAFKPYVGRLSVFGTPCGGPALGAYLTPTTLGLLASGIPKVQYALLNFGTKALTVAIPPLGCILFTDLLVPISVPVSAGTATLRIPLPRPLPSGVFRVQLLASDGMAWRISNAVQIQL